MWEVVPGAPDRVNIHCLIQNCSFNPAFECTIDPNYKQLFARKESPIPSFGIRIQSLLDVSNIRNDNVHAAVIPQVPPWTMHH